MLRCLLWALAAAVQPKALLIADNQTIFASGNSLYDRPLVKGDT